MPSPKVSERHLGEQQGVPSEADEADWRTSSRDTRSAAPPEPALAAVPPAAKALIGQPKGRQQIEAEPPAAAEEAPPHAVNEEPVPPRQRPGRGGSNTSGVASCLVLARRVLRLVCKMPDITSIKSPVLQAPSWLRAE